ncbi:MAG: riboflavin synthase [Candidatus Magasanikbacteria bacterium CG10_big_fil_rev_8_21_14_0_10_43_6]|uniref:Riboflavin synthase n=1 Tax=Candidatus Magasanikbacteria bacterium CG10_big_fil_rev_8_21_14_0_10_43_6 TaxID=1974650 RepID=A0A2M6W1M1_9BACT|nr:MAG: riboflavin synthase [Candidatus Magasanikbacteria bacterium CG10_big_fil_rev_8_21_14_0_10_43_6]
MFTGIIQSIGILKKKEQNDNSVLFGIEDAAIYAQVQEGSSVAVAGVCLTVKEKKEAMLYFDVMIETIRKTTLEQFTNGQRVNLEPGLKIGDELGGHFVYGHVSAVAEVTDVVFDGPSILLSVRVPQEQTRYIVPESSITIDGVSLTVARAQGDLVTVSLVDYTLEHTTLHMLEPGDRVNIEVDMLAKYIEKLLSNS